MRGLRLPNRPLPELLVPANAALDSCWWAFQAGSTLPLVNSPYPSKPYQEWSAREVERFNARLAAAEAEFRKWIHDHPSGEASGYEIARPGWFSRYGAYLNSDWQVLLASDALRAEECSFDQARSAVGHDLLGPISEMPADIVVAAIGIDGAAWNVFLRDEWMYAAVRTFAQAHWSGVHVLSPSTGEPIRA